MRIRVLSRSSAAVLGLTALWWVACSGGGEPRSTTAPTIIAIGPNRTTPGSGPLGLLVEGENFTDSFVVLWNGAPRNSYYHGGRYLGAVIPSGDLASPGSARIRVHDPVSGETSGPVTFVVAAGAVPFSIDSFLPRNGAEVPPGTPLVAYFSEAVDTTSLSDSTIRVLEDGTPIPHTFVYDEAEQSVTISATITPSRRYGVEFAEPIRSVPGGLFGGGRVTDFTSAPAPVVILDAAGWSPTLVLLNGQNPRIAYVQGPPGPLKVASCSVNCETIAAWTNTSPPTVGFPEYPALATNGPATLDLAYQDGTNGALRYIRLPSTTGVVRAGVAAYTSVATYNGSTHLFQYSNGVVEHANCTTGCSSTGNWTLDTVDTQGNVGAYSSAAADGTGAVHVAYLANDPGDLRFASCAAPCTNGPWTTVTLDSTGVTGVGNSLAAEPAGTLHLGYVDDTRHVLRYGTCAAQCTIATNWILADVAPLASSPVTSHGFYYVSLALGPNGTVHISHQDMTTGEVRLASCAAGCGAPAGWTIMDLSNRGGGSGSLTSLKLDVAGSRHLVWVAPDGSLRYMKF